MNWRICLAIAAAILALCPFIGRWSGAVDAFSSFLPFALPLAFVTLIPFKSRPSAFVVVTSLAAICIAAMTIVPEWHAASRDGDIGAGDRLVVVTHNVAVANVAPEQTIRELASTDADVLLLQETDGTVAPFLMSLSASFPYHNRCVNRCSLAIFSKLPIEQVRYRFRNSSGSQIGPSLLRTRILLPDGSTAPLVTLHLPWPWPPGPQARTRSSLVDTLTAQDRDDLILAGDFNLTPWSAAMARLDEELNPLRRVTRALPSYPARVRGHIVPAPIFPIDQLFAGSSWSTISVKRLARTGSDHYPVRIELVRRRSSGDDATRSMRTGDPQLESVR